MSMRCLIERKSPILRAIPLAAALLLGGLLSGAALPASSSITAIGSPSGAEGNSGTTSLTFVVTATCSQAVNVIIDWRIDDGTATTADSDYADTSGQLDDVCQGAGTETFNVAVAVNGDTNFEPDETFTLVLFGASVGEPSFALDVSSGTATILNDDSANSPPTATAGGPYSVNEGGTVMLDGSGSSDPDQSTASLSFAWDLDDNGSYETAGINPIFSAAGLDGPTTKTVGLRVTDSGSLTDTDTATVNVQNVAPSVIVSSATVTVNEGSPAANSGTFSDPGSESVTIGASVGSVVQGPGTWNWTFATNDGPDDSQTVTITANDGVTTTSETFSLLVDNVAPSLTVGSASVTVDEGNTAANSGTFSDPGADTVSFAASVGTVSSTTSTWSWSFDTEDGPADSQTVTITGTDSDGASTQTTFALTVNNVPPTVDSPVVTPEPSEEGESVTASATFTDPATDDSPFTCAVDYGDGAVAGAVAGLNCTGPSHTYGDDGSYAVTIDVTDKDGGTGSETSDHQVDNVDPSATLDTAGAIMFPGGDAFVGRQRVDQDHDADADDPGSDDLTFVWDFLASSASTTYYNDTGTAFGTADPPLSPHGTFPFAVSDTTTVNFADAGLFMVRIDVEDDDAGVDSEELAKLVTGDTDCTRSHGFWRRQFRSHDDDGDSDSDSDGGTHFDATTLQAFLDVVDFASSVFSEVLPASDISGAEEVFAPGGSKRDKAVREALAAWLNFASGAVGVSETVRLDDSDSDSDNGGGPDPSFLEVMTVVEAIVADPAASRRDLVLAKDLAEAVNHLDDRKKVCRHDD